MIVGENWGVQNQRVVLHVGWRDLVIPQEVCAHWSSLRSLAREPMERKAVALVDGVVELEKAVVAVAVFRIGIVVVIGAAGPVSASAGQSVCSRL